MENGFLKDRVALVTGGGQGVGRGIALGLAKAGASVVVTGRTESKLDDVCAEIEGMGGTAAGWACNIKDGDAIGALIKKIEERFGRLDILVNNAQEVPLGPLLAVDDDAFMAGFVSGPLATHRLMKACHSMLKQGDNGVVFNLASSAGVRWDMANYGAYGAVKQAIRALTRAAASEWGPDNIRVLSIAPHADSPGLKKWIETNPEEARVFFQTIPLRRVGGCETDIGEAVAALCDPAFSYLTGATIPLDGGQANFD
ncbi:SDR family oxidoreductase [Croceicoccus sp. F390]|uniref:SDR family oxidoreductase n=1 Tax=Croceicoccus esteveae TaxID=3075597 RepID=A0ABU2ZFJ1_9SPHN|nr:SDR family oxidoreductase [Croceicoccus sp. F390]MDT0575366.1 SDR family oxidoreductase [Croceicoccus sp. F390]